MAESSPLRRSIFQGSDQVPEEYCEACFNVNSTIKPVAGYCIDCQESLCLDCYTTHLLPKPLRNHRLVDKSTRPKSKFQTQRHQEDTSDKCPRHHGESLQSFCKSHSQLCCKVCLAIDHKKCHTEKISKMARNIKSSEELKNLNKKLSTLKKGFNENINKTETNRSNIKKYSSEAIDERKKLRDNFERLMTENENQVELSEIQDLKKVESVAETSNVVIDQINKMKINVDMLLEKGDNEGVFISIKRAEIELHSMEESLKKLKSDNTVREYKLEPNLKLKDLLGTNITVSDTNLECHGSVMLPNKQILITEPQNNAVKLIDTSNGSIISKIHLSNTPANVTSVSPVEVAVTLPEQNKIQILSLAQNKFFLAGEIDVYGECYGIAYNSKVQSFIVSFTNPGKMEIISKNGEVVKVIETDARGSQLFVSPTHVALSPDMTEMYVSDSVNYSVTKLTLNGDVKAVYRNKRMKYPAGICVNKAGHVYVVGRGSNTVHQLKPRSGEFKLLLNETDGLYRPWSISYCDVEDKIYVGMYVKNYLKVFEMKK